MASGEEVPSETPSMVVKHSHRALIQIVIASAVLVLLVPLDSTLATYWLAIIYLWSFLMWFFGKTRIHASIRELRSDLAHSWYVIVLVVFGVQTCATLFLTYVFPQAGEHAMHRVPFDPDTDLLTFLVIVVLYGPVVEEFIFRGIVQENLTRFVSEGRANALTSAVFAFIHWSPGAASSIAIDLLIVFMSSLFFGVIYSRTRNIVTSILAHSGFNLYGPVLGHLLDLFGP